MDRAPLPAGRRCGVEVGDQGRGGGGLAPLRDVGPGAAPQLEGERHQEPEDLPAPDRGHPQAAARRAAEESRHPARVLQPPVSEGRNCRARAADAAIERGSAGHVRRFEGDEAGHAERLPPSGAGYRGRMRTVNAGGTTLMALCADLTRQEVDAIVNAANEWLAHGGGLAAAIVAAGGEEIQEESDRWVAAHGPLSPGVAAVTGAGRLPARFVIHVAGPRYREGQDNEGLLRLAVRTALDAAATHGCRTVALPAISAGIFGYPLGEATAVTASASAAWARAHPGGLDEIRLIGFNAAAEEAFAAGLA